MFCLILSAITAIGLLKLSGLLDQPAQSGFSILAVIGIIFIAMWFFGFLWQLAVVPFGGQKIDPSFLLYWSLMVFIFIVVEEGLFWRDSLFKVLYFLAAACFVYLGVKKRRYREKGLKEMLLGPGLWLVFLLTLPWLFRSLVG